jgi:endonuclease YncB( thermonuclease family)
MGVAMRRRFRRRPPFALVLLAMFAAAVVVRLGWDAWQRGIFSRHPGAAASFDRRSVPFVAGPCTVVRAISGDTLLVRQDQSLPRSTQHPGTVEGPVRLLGIRAAARGAPPASLAEPSAVAAREYIEEFVGRGDVTLELDKRRLDADGRFLAYVVVDGAMLNVELVRQGLARMESQAGDSATISRLLRRAEDEARLAGRGIWKADEKSARDEAKSDDPA